MTTPQPPAVDEPDWNSVTVEPVEAAAQAAPAAPASRPKTNGEVPRRQRQREPQAVGAGHAGAPRAIEAEQSVLGAILIDPDALRRVSPELEAADFYRPQHGQIYTAMHALQAAGTPSDLVTLADALEERGTLEEVGGRAYLATLMNAVPTAVHVEHYAETVRARALARRLIEAGGRLVGAGYENPNDPQAALAELERISAAVRGSWPTRELEAPARELDAAARGPSPVRLDQLQPVEEPDAWAIEGLSRPGALTAVVAPPGSAKSWATLQLAMCAAAGPRSFLDHYPIERALNVLLLDEDNGDAEQRRREETMLEHLGLQRSELARFWRLSLAGVQLDQERWQLWLRGLIRMHEIELLILDPVSEMHGGKELRDDPAFRSLLIFLKRLKVDFPALAVILVHHTRKAPSGDRSGTRSLDDVRGQWGQTPDVVALMSPLAERRIRWEIHKRAPSSRLILEATEAGPLTTVADETTSATRRQSTEDRVLVAIEVGAEHWDEIRNATGLSKSGIFKALQRLRMAGLVSKGEPYRLVDDPAEDPMPWSTPQPEEA